MSIESLFESIQGEALPGIWSKGVALAREKKVILDSKKPGEYLLRLQAPGKAVSPSVTIWDKDGDEDAHCDCGDRVEPCIHIVASVVALKNDWMQSANEARPTTARLVYRFILREEKLSIERVLIRPGQNADSQVLRESLVSFIGGVESGRVSFPTLPTTRYDFRVDQGMR